MKKSPLPKLQPYQKCMIDGFLHGGKIVLLPRQMDKRMAEERVTKYLEACGYHAIKIKTKPIQPKPSAKTFFSWERP